MVTAGNETTATSAASTATATADKTGRKRGNFVQPQDESIPGKNLRLYLGNVIGSAGEKKGGDYDGDGVFHSRSRRRGT